MENTNVLAGLEFFELLDLIAKKGWSQKHALELFALIQRKGTNSVNQVPKNLLPKKMHEWLATCSFWSSGIAWSSQLSADGSTKYILEYQDGKRIEALFMPSQGRDSICLSSQAGCAMGCTFCATGKMGLLRNLSALEILEQVRVITRHQDAPGRAKRRLNLFFMGMGEPLHNYDQSMKAFRILSDHKGMGIPPRDIGFSTCGYLPGIEKLALEDNRPCLMLSIGSTLPEKRNQIMPVNRSWSLEKLIDTLKHYPLRKKEKIMLTYVLIQGENDSVEDAKRLVAVSKKFPSMINVIPMNEHPFSPDMKEPDEAHLKVFTRYIMDRGAFCTIRRSRGRDIAGACGQFIQGNRDKLDSLGLL